MKQQQDLSALTDDELVMLKQKMKQKSIVNALLIGFLLGVLYYSVIKNSLGFLSLIPIYMLYKLINNSKYDKAALAKIMKERNLDN